MHKIILPIVTVLTVVSCTQPRLCGSNVDRILGQLTTDEKLHLLVGASGLSGEDTTEVEMIAACKKASVPGCAGYTWPVFRLGINSIILADGPAGLRIEPTREGNDSTFYCTGFPIGTSLASTWNQPLVAEVASAMGVETREYGVDILLAPGANLHRSPLCGRNFEYFSEDPLLSGKTAASFICGLQSEGVGASLKHFAANNEEVNRLCCDSRVDVTVLRELYLRNFEIAVRERHPWTIMSSYNYLNGLPTSENAELLEDVLRKDWGYDGLVVSDWGGGYDTPAMIRAGNDLIMPGGQDRLDEIRKAVEDGSLSMEDVDRDVRRVLQLIAKCPNGKGYKPSQAPDLKTHAELARKAGSEGMVLLKNDNVLPFDNGKCLAMFGTNSYKLLAGGTGAGDVNKAYVINLDQGLCDAGFTLEPLLDGAYRAFVSSEDERLRPLNEARGWWFGDLLYDEMPSAPGLAAAASESADAAVVTIVRQAGEGKDRLVKDDFLLRSDELALIDAVSDAFHNAGKKVVVVLNIAGIVEVASFRDKVDAILIAWQPGQEAGYCIADVLGGKVNPSGKLPMTIPVSYSDVPSQNFPQVEIPEGVNGSYYRYTAGKKVYEIPNVDYIDYDEGLMMGYRYYTTRNVPVAYPFGYGLSYTDFNTRVLGVKETRGGWKVNVEVTNTGNTAGKQVVEIYRRGAYPALELVAYAKTDLLEAGQNTILSLELTPRSFTVFDQEESAWIAKSGVYSFCLASDASTPVEDFTIELKRSFREDVSRSLYPTANNK